MKTIELHRNPLIHREEWPDGPWDEEPDKIQWLDEKSGYPCLLVRNRLGGLCGYVGVPDTHQFYGVHFGDVHLPGGEWPPAHGGLTYSDKCQEGEGATICHVVEEGEDDDVWWLGFDCGHFRDLMPGMVAMDKRIGLDQLDYKMDQTYKNVAYVKAECAELARWLKENA